MKNRGAYGKGDLPKAPKTLGERIRKIRLAWGWTQGRLAEAVHSKQNVVSHWEKNQSQPSGAALGSLASLFRLAPDALLTGKGFTIATPPMEDPSVGAVHSDDPLLLVHLPVTHEVQALYVDHQAATVRLLPPGKASGLIREALAEGKHVWLVIK